MALTETQLLMTPAGDIDHLHAWILKFTGLDFPKKTVSRFSTSNPTDFIWNNYSAIMDGRPYASLGLAGRDSFKTLALSILDLLSFLHDARHTVHIAMTTQQGSRARNYLDRYINRIDLLRNAVVKQNTREISLNIGGQNVGMEILPATPKAVQGAHCALLTFDEVASSMEPKNVQAYRDAHGILGSSEKGKPAVIVKITSRQAGYSLAEEELRNAAKSGLVIHKWTTLDATERCPDERSGTIKQPLWINPLRDEKYTDEEYKHLAAARKEGFLYSTDTFDKCRTCPIAAFCCGDLKKQESNSPLLRTIDDVINKIRLSGSWDWGVAQIMSMKPSSEGLVYFEFDRQVHVPGWDAMWISLTGQKPTEPVNRETFTAELKKRGALFYAGIDWGWSSPSTCVVLAVDRREMVYVIDTMGRTLTSDPEFIELVRTTLHRKYDIQMYCPDLANGSGNSLLRQADLPTTDEIDKKINMGVNLVKGLLRVPGTNGASRLFFAPDIASSNAGHAGMLEEFELYHKKMDATNRILDNDDPHDSHNHYMDALRYCVYWLFGRMRMKVGTDYMLPDQVDPFSGDRSNIPTLDQISLQHGIQYTDNRHVLDEPNKGPDDPDDGGRPGGAIWSWT